MHATRSTQNHQRQRFQHYLPVETLAMFLSQVMRINGNK